MAWERFSDADLVSWADKEEERVRSLRLEAQTAAAWAECYREELARRRQVREAQKSAESASA